MKSEAHWECLVRITLRPSGSEEASHHSWAPPHPPALVGRRGGVCPTQIYLRDYAGSNQDPSPLNPKRSCWGRDKGRKGRRGSWQPIAACSIRTPRLTFLSPPLSHPLGSQALLAVSPPQSGSLHSAQMPRAAVVPGLEGPGIQCHQVWGVGFAGSCLPHSPPKEPRYCSLLWGM